MIDPFTGQTAVFNINGQVNGPDADVRGLELALQYVFGNTGFGFQANATLVNTNRKFPTNDISGQRVRDHRPRQFGELRRASTTSTGSSSASR